MEVLAHRGFWFSRQETNSEAAIRRAFSHGFGIETDLRDQGSHIVISHDASFVPSHLSEPLMSFDRFLDIYEELQPNSTLALNIKADGLASVVYDTLIKRNINTYFVFDMSVPDTLHYLRAKMSVFTRWSEFEAGSVLDNRAEGIWLDAFENPDVSAGDIARVISRGQKAAIVSPELHGRPHEAAWAEWRSFLTANPSLKDKLLLCTDFPLDAQAYFDLRRKAT